MLICYFLRTKFKYSKKKNISRAKGSEIELFWEGFDLIYKPPLVILVSCYLLSASNIDNSMTF